MFCGFVGLIAMSTSLSPLSAGPSFEMFVVVRTREPPWAAVAPTANASATTSAPRILGFNSPSSVGLRVRAASLTPRFAQRLGRRLGDPFGGLEELVPRAKLHARASELLARGPLEL